MGKKYGYVRVSTREQHEERQLFSMQENGVAKENIFMDKQSGSSFARPGYLRMMKKLRPGDILYLHSIDRLGRNYEEILQQWQIITKEKKVDVVVLDMPLLNTGKRNRTSPGHSSRIWSCRSSAMSLRPNGTTSASGRPRASRQPSAKACTAAESLNSRRIILKKSSKDGGRSCTAEKRQPEGWA